VSASCGVRNKQTSFYMIVSQIVVLSTLSVNLPGGFIRTEWYYCVSTAYHQQEKWDFLLLSAHNRVVMEKGLLIYLVMCGSSRLCYSLCFRGWCTTLPFHSEVLCMTHIARQLVSGDCGHSDIERCHLDLPLRQQCLALCWFGTDTHVSE